MSDDRIPVYLTRDEVELLTEMPDEYQGQRCCYCRAWWMEGVGYEHETSCSLLAIAEAARIALSPESHAYAWIGRW